jgi:LysM repeat protein
LRIPQARAEQPPSQEQQPEATGSSITVARGDTLSGLASRHGTTVAALKSLNGLRSDTIVVGQELRLPAASAANAPERQQATASSGQGSSYTVRAGDTPSGIARRFGISAQQLMAANGITDARRLFVGQDLIIPGNAAARTDRGRQPSARAAEPASEPVVRPQTTAPQRELSAPTREPLRQEPPREEAAVDPMSALEALEEEDLPFVEVETIDNGEE